MFGKKRKRMDQSSDEDDGDRSEEDKFDMDDLLNLIDSNANLEYQPIPVNNDLVDSSGLNVTFEELIIDKKRMGFVRCQTADCPSKKDRKTFYGHFKPHLIEKNRSRMYKKTILERHINRWHKATVMVPRQRQSSSSQSKLRTKIWFSNAIDPKI